MQICALQDFSLLDNCEIHKGLLYLGEYDTKWTVISMYGTIGKIYRTRLHFKFFKNSLTIAFLVSVVLGTLDTS